MSERRPDTLGHGFPTPPKAAPPSSMAWLVYEQWSAAQRIGGAACDRFFVGQDESGACERRSSLSSSAREGRLILKAHASRRRVVSAPKLLHCSGPHPLSGTVTAPTMTPDIDRTPLTPSKWICMSTILGYPT
jgi:hypothetical protein